MSEFEVTHRELYTNPDRLPAKDGVLDRRLVSGVPRIVQLYILAFYSQGTVDKSSVCETCGSPTATCVGHYAYIKLVLPVFHIGYFKHVITILQDICKVGAVCVGIEILLKPICRPARVCYWTNPIVENTLNDLDLQISKTLLDRLSRKLSTLLVARSCIVLTVLQSMGQ